MHPHSTTSSPLECAVHWFRILQVNERACVVTLVIRRSQWLVKVIRVRLGICRLADKLQF